MRLNLGKLSLISCYRALSVYSTYLVEFWCRKYNRDMHNILLVRIDYLATVIVSLRIGEFLGYTAAQFFIVFSIGGFAALEYVRPTGYCANCWPQLARRKRSHG
jgi:hypothetical protein